MHTCTHTRDEYLWVYEERKEHHRTYLAKVGSHHVPDAPGFVLTEGFQGRQKGLLTFFGGQDMRYLDEILDGQETNSVLFIIGKFDKQGHDLLNEMFFVQCFGESLHTHTSASKSEILSDGYMRVRAYTK